MSHDVLEYRSENDGYNNGSTTVPANQRKTWTRSTREQGYVWLVGYYTEEWGEHRTPAYIDTYIDENNSDTQMICWGGGDNAYGVDREFATAGHNYWTDNDALKISIHTPIIMGKCDSDGAENGYFKFRARGGRTDSYEYRLEWEDLSQELYSTDGVFSGLPPGNYTLKINEFDNVDLNSGNIPVTMEELPTYGIPYVGHFKNEFGREVEVQILRTNYVGESEEICLGGVPVLIDVDIVGDDFLSGVQPLNIAVEVIKERDDQFNQFFITDNDAWLIRVIDAGYLDVTGRLIIENIEIAHQDNPVTIQLNATAGFADIVDEVIEDWSGPILFIDVINHIQQEYNIMTYPIREFVGMRESLDTSTNIWETFRKYYVEASVFNESEPKEAINLILHAFGCSLTHSFDNHIHIQGTTLLTLVGDTLMRGATYTRQGEFVSNEYLNPSAIFIDCSRNEDGFYIEGSQGYGSLPKVNKYSVTNEFKECVYYEIGLDPLDYRIFEPNPYYNGSLESGVDEDDNPTLRFNGLVVRDQIYTYAEVRRISNDSFRVLHPNLHVKYSFDFRYDEDTANTKITELSNKHTQVIMMYGKNNCLNTGENCNYNIGTIHWQTSSELGEWQSFSHQSQLVDFNDDSIDIDPSGEILRVWMMGLWSLQSVQDEEEEEEFATPKYAEFKNMKWEVLLPETWEDEDKITLSFDAGNDGVNLKEDILEIGDAPADKRGYGIQIGGIMMRENKILTTNWQSYTHPTGETFLGHALDRVQYLRGKNVKRLEGVIESEYPTIGKVLYDPSLDGTFFMLQRFSYDLKFNKLGFSALESIASTGVRLIESDLDRETEDDNPRQLQ